MWSAETLAALTVGSPIEFRLLPDGAGFTVSIRRATRVGASTGLPIEDIGVGGHLRYSLTRDDLIDSNKDLFAFCGQLLSSVPRTDLNIKAASGTLSIATTSLSSIDIFIDRHPAGGSSTVSDSSPLTVPYPAFEEILEVRGFKGSISSNEEFFEHDPEGRQEPYRSSHPSIPLQQIDWCLTAPDRWANSSAAYLLETCSSWPVGPEDLDELQAMPEWEQAREWGWIMRTGRLTGTGSRHVGAILGGIVHE